MRLHILRELQHMEAMQLDGSASKPHPNEHQIWRPFINKCYPFMLKTVNHDLLHFMFQKAAEFQMLPIIEP